MRWLCLTRSSSLLKDSVLSGTSTNVFNTFLFIFHKHNPLAKCLKEFCKLASISRCHSNSFVLYSRKMLHLPQLAWLCNSPNQTRLRSHAHICYFYCFISGQRELEISCSVLQSLFSISCAISWNCSTVALLRQFGKQTLPKIRSCAPLSLSECGLIKAATQTSQNSIINFI